MSPSKKADPRALSSKRELKKAIVSLLSENPDTTTLTVQKIADKAELNRATFYLHYLDINDLLRHLVLEIFDDLSQKLTPFLEIESMKDEEKLLGFLDYFYQHRKLFAVLFEGPQFKIKLHELLKDFVQNRRGIRGATNQKTSFPSICWQPPFSGSLCGGSRKAPSTVLNTLHIKSA